MDISLNMQLISKLDLKDLETKFLLDMKFFFIYIFLIDEEKKDKIDFSTIVIYISISKWILRNFYFWTLFKTFVMTCLTFACM